MRGLCYFLLTMLTQGGSSTVNVTGLIGHDVTLPCKYSQTRGVLSFCWGRGPVPTFKCSNRILASEDGAVQFRQSPKYQLLGGAAGDASLTILDAQRSDSGVYGCRVEVPGWFNDYKLDTHLLMEEAPVEQVATKEGTGSTEISTSASHSKDDARPKQSAIRRITYPDKFNTFLEVGNVSRIGVIFFITTMIIIFIFWRRFKLRKTPEHHDTSAAENIYDSIPMPE